jgi:hypothetical protein
MEERGPFLFSPGQARSVKLIWPEADLIDEPDTTPMAHQEKPKP